jgi:hypothetical protein
LALLNAASTDHAAARALCRDILAGLLLLGARAISSPVHELVNDLLDGESPAPGVASAWWPAIPPPAPAPSRFQLPDRARQVAGYAAELPAARLSLARSPRRRASAGGHPARRG